jgi:hypothetical protein
MGRGPLFIISGRWDNNVAVVSLKRALDRSNRGTPRAIVRRPRVTPDIDEDGARVPKMREADTEVQAPAGPT